MAEILGAVASAVTLAEVFKVCIDAFELIRAAQKHDTEVKKLTLKLNIEKCRLLVWGRSMGLVAYGDNEPTSRLDDCPFSDVVRETLESITELLSNSQNLARKYGCRRIEGSTDILMAIEEGPVDPSTRLAAVFEKLNINAAFNDRLKTTGKKVLWAVHDYNKFGVLLQDAKYFIHGLQDITKEIVTLRNQ